VPRPQGVALDVPAHDQQVVIILDRKALEAPLVDMTAPHRVVVNVPALRMGHGKPRHKAGEITVISRPQDQMPVRGHHAIGKDRHPQAHVGLLENLLKGPVISGVGKQRRACVPPVENVIHHPARR
jgi:hypothetical protein